MCIYHNAVENHIIDEYAGVIIGLIVSYSMINIFGNIFTGVIRI